MILCSYQKQGRQIKKSYHGLDSRHLIGLGVIGLFEAIREFRIFYCNIMEAREQGSPVEVKIQPKERQLKVEKPERKIKMPKHEEEDSNGRVQSSTYYWTHRENRSYLKFLKEKGNLFKLDAVQRKKEKTNLRLSKYVKTRTPTQCHTHHQKMMIKYGSVERAIVEMELKYALKPSQREKKERALQAAALEESKKKVNKKERQPNEQRVGHLGGNNILKEENDLDYIYY